MGQLTVANCGFSSFLARWMGFATGLRTPRLLSSAVKGGVAGAAKHLLMHPAEREVVYAVVSKCTWRRAFVTARSRDRRREVCRMVQHASRRASGSAVQCSLKCWSRLSGVSTFMQQTEQADPY